MIEIALARRVKRKRIMQGGSLVNVQEWVWWDELTLHPSQADPDVVLMKIKDKNLIKQQQVQERLALESIDRDAINKLVGYVSNMACTRASTSANALMSADVLAPFKAFIDGIELNSARLRLRTLNDDHAALFNVSEDIDDLQITLPAAHTDEHTTGYTISEDAPQPVVSSSKDKHQPELDTRPSPLANDKSVSLTGSSPAPPSSSLHDAADTQQPVKKPKPRPIARKHRQPSPAPVIDLVHSSSSSSEEDEDEATLNTHDDSKATDGAGYVDKEMPQESSDDVVVRDPHTECTHSGQRFFGA
ncbi:hypothetical protein BDR05DRAFT_1006963 [Suillus weaverae]|nr:hypothetical protein BDR05DRAFT_1006963 [Suillus weaverae]